VTSWGRPMSRNPYDSADLKRYRRVRIPLGPPLRYCWSFRPRSLRAVGGGMRILIFVPIVLVKLVDHLLQVRLREPRVHRRRLKCTDVRDKALVALMCYGGLRRSEIVVLDVGDVAPGPGLRRVQGKGGVANRPYRSPKSRSGSWLTTLLRNGPRSRRPNRSSFRASRRRVDASPRRG